MTSSTDDRSLVHHTGRAYFPIAFVARLPFAMMVVGVLTLVASATQSVALAGLTSAAVGIGVVIAGPVIGDLVDRHGQRAVLLPVGIANGVLLALFPLIVLSGAPAPLTLAAAALIGLSAPQAAALSRTRLVAITRSRLSEQRHERTLSNVMAYESAADETAFVIGPVLVGLLAGFVAPWAPIAIAAALSLVFVSAFAVHPSAAVADAPHRGDDESGAASGSRASDDRAPLRSLLAAPVLVLVAATFAVGLFFGATLTSLTAFVQSEGHGDIAGLLYGLMGVGSAVLALGVMLLPSRFALRWRWLAFALVLLVAAAGYALAADLPAVTVMLCAAGIGVGPTLVTLFSLAGERSPRGRSATTMTLLGSALTLAQAVASALSGALAEATSPQTAMLLPVIAAALVVALGVANVFVGRAPTAATAAQTEAEAGPGERVFA